MLRSYTYQNQSNSLFTNRSEFNFSFTQGTGPFFSQPLTPPVDPETDISHYEVAIVSVADYSPFTSFQSVRTLRLVGVQLDGRTMESEKYRYGFQNQEKDDEVKGEGNSVNYRYRMHSLYRLFGNPRLGRFFAVDPLGKDYPYYSPYTFSGNIVINCIELEGLEPEPVYDEASWWYSWLFSFFGTDKEHELKEKVNPLPKYEPKRNSKGQVLIENTTQATIHYYRGNGESVTLSPGTQNLIINSEDMIYYRNRIKSGKTSSPEKGSGLPVNVTNESAKTYHVGRTTFSYSTNCSNGNCTTTYTFSGDGFWDIFSGDDKIGNDGELGGKPYKYNTFIWSETYANPGYPVDSSGTPSKNVKKVEKGDGPPNESSGSSSYSGSGF